MDRNFYYIVMPITVAKNVTISPEIGKLDNGDTKVLGATTDNGDQTYYGVYWKIAW